MWRPQTSGGFEIIQLWENVDAQLLFKVGCSSGPSAGGPREASAPEKEGVNSFFMQTLGFSQHLNLSPALGQ